MTTTIEENPKASVIPSVGEDEYHIFLTYHPDDEAYANTLDEKLKDKGYKVYMEDRDSKAGKTEHVNLELAIAKCLKIVIVLSRKYVENKWQIYQASMALYHMTIDDDAEQKKKGRITIIPVLYNPEGCDNPLNDEDIPVRLSMLNYIHSDKEHFYERLFAAINANLTLSDALPAGNVAYGLAWSYFYGYLNLILKDLPDRIKKCQEIWNSDLSQRKVALRMFLIIPKSCYCPTSFEEADSRIKNDAELEKYFASRAGNPKRPYPAYSKKITMENGEEYFFVGEFVTPVLAMYEMEVERISGLSQTEKYKQVRLFYNALKEILNHPNAGHCHGRTILHFYDDEAKKDGKPYPLADRLVEMIKVAIGEDIMAEKIASEYDTPV